jgi:serine/threonine protein kinase
VLEPRGAKGSKDRRGKEVHVPVAVKRMKRDRAGFELGLVRREAALMRRVRHPGCVRLLRFLEAPDAVYLVEDLAHGGTLKATARSLCLLSLCPFF